MKLRSHLVGAVAFAAALPAFAQVKINDALTVTGWATGSYQYTQPKPGTSYDSFNLDGAELQATATPAKKTTVVASLYYRPSGEGGVSPSGSEITLLDAYVSYAASDQLTLTAGKFLSNLGYESFYFNQDNMITLANQALLGPIPGYHEGVKADFAATKTDTLGVAVVDSLYQKVGYNATEGDGELKHNGGFEAYYTNNGGLPGLQVWLGVGYQTKTQAGTDTSGVQLEPVGTFGTKGYLADIQKGSAITVGDVWLTYALDKNGDQIALEEIYKSGGYANKGNDWLAYLLYNLPNSKISSWFAISGENVSNGGASYVKYSVAPTYTFNSSLAFRLQYSYTDYSKFTISSSNYFGAETIFHF